MRFLLEIYITFFKVGISTFGGGYAMLPILEKEVVENKKWASMPEVMDYYAISQCTPGIIAINTATYIGYQIKKLSGAIAASLGVFSPSVIIILLISGLIQNFSSLQIVEHAFNGIQICVAVIIINAVIKMLKASIVDKITICLFVISFFVMLIFDISAIIIILLAVIFGIYFGRLKK